MIQPTGLDPGFCPRCGGELEWKATIDGFDKTSKVHFFNAKTAAAFIRFEPVTGDPYSFAGSIWFHRDYAFLPESPYIVPMLSRVRIEPIVTLECHHPWMSSKK